MSKTEAERVLAMEENQDSGLNAMDGLQMVPILMGVAPGLVG